MPKTTEQLAASKAGQTAETNGFGSQETPLRPSGLYQLKNKAGEVVDTLILKTHPKFGDGQASAAERVGYEYVRPATKEEVKTIEVDTLTLATERTTLEDQKGIQARLSALEDEGKKKDEQIAALLAERNDNTDGTVKSDAKAEAQDEAIARTEARLDSSVGAGAEETQRTEELKEERREDGVAKNDAPTAPTDDELKPAKDEASVGNTSKGGGSNTNTNSKKEGK